MIIATLDKSTAGKATMEQFLEGQEVIWKQLQEKQDAVFSKEVSYDNWEAPVRGEDPKEEAMDLGYVGSGGTLDATSRGNIV
jgi:hypothetical protein